MRLIIQLAVVAAIALAGSTLVGVVAWNPPLTLVLGLGTSAVALLGYAWAVRRTERRAPDELSRTGAVPALVRGTLLGVGMFAAVILTIALLGGYQVLGWGAPAGAVALFGFMAAAAVTEELLFRGILFRIVEQWAGTWIALVLTAALFGTAHLFNPHSTVWGAIAIAIEAGAMLAAAYAATRTLWLPIGLHFGWNYAASAVFGTAVSGGNTPDGLLHAVMNGPTALTGGDFGPEASVYAVLSGAALTVVFLWLAHRRGRIVPRRGARNAPLTTLAP
ncbi:CPBP family intramembrane glutamic endopeptidase [Pseudonocardia sichuanensis]